MADAISDAIELLRQRREQAVTELGRLQGEITRIDGALTSLGDAGRPLVDVSHTEGSNGKNPNLTVAALDRIESVDKWWSMDDLVAGLRSVQGGRTDEQLKATIRTAMWTLRKRGQIISNGHGRHKASRYVDDPLDTSAPAATGAEGDVPTSGLGGDADEAPAQDHRDLSRWDGDHHRTPVGVLG